MQAVEIDLNQRMPALITLLREKPVLNVAECSVLSTLSIQTLYRAMRSGRLQTCAPGRVLREDLDVYLRRERDARAKQ